LDEFYDNFLSKDAPLSFLSYYSEKPGHKDFKLQDHKQEENNIETYLISMFIPITGVPFCK
jgi:hypothetical protein